MHQPNAANPATPHLTLTGHPADWRSLATALTSAGRPVLANFIRAGLAFAPRDTPTESVALAFDAAHALAIQRFAAALGIRLATAPTDAAAGREWVTSAAERAEAVTAAEALIRAHQRRSTA